MENNLVTLRILIESYFCSKLTAKVNIIFGLCKFIFLQNFYNSHIQF
jgi:hypothetical protein